MRPLTSLLVLGAFGCAAPPLAADPASTPTSHDTGTPPATTGDVSLAPQPAETLSGKEAAWVAHCGKPDRALFAVARDLAKARAAGGAMPATEEIAHRLRVAGAPYVWPAAVGLTGTATDADIVERLKALRAQVEGEEGEARCGFGIVEKPPANGFAATQFLVAIAVANVGSFEKLPLHVAPGQWLTAKAHFPRGLRSGSAYLLGPSGSPRSVQATLSPKKDSLVVKFAPEADGEFLLQMLGDVGSGPRPLFEALVVSGKGNEQRKETAQKLDLSDDEAGVLAKINDLRAQHKQKPLVLDGALAKLAVAHAGDMSSAKKLAHDVGKGSPDDRVKRAGLVLRVVGENVSYAKGVLAAHDGIERSPSHRANVLRPDFTKVGIGFVRESDGMVYLAEVFGG